MPSRARLDCAIAHGLLAQNRRRDDAGGRNCAGSQLGERSAVAIALVLLIDAAAAAPETLTVDGRKLLMDGKPWVMRGVTYAPTPVGNDPGWGRGSTADYHSTDYSDIHARDIDLLEEMGVNTIRVYDVGDSEEGQHEFWERLDNSNISVMAGIELHVPTGGGWASGGRSRGT